MADQDQKPPLKVQSSPGSPGLSGAIKDAVAALSGAFAPKSITQRGAKVKQAIDQGSGAQSLGDELAGGQ